MIKIIGAVLLCACSFFWGMEKSREAKSKLLYMEGLIEFVKYTGEQISLFKAPLPKIFESFSNEELKACGFTDALKTGGASVAVKTLKGNIPNDCYTEAENFAKALGNGYCEGQTELCRLTILHLSEHLEKLNESLPGKVRVYRMLPILLAASVVILLI